MTITDKQYMAFSQLAYLNFDKAVDNKPLDEIDYLNKPLSSFDLEGLFTSQKNKFTKSVDGAPSQYDEFVEKGVFESVRGWEIIKYENKNDFSGFCGTAF